METALEKHMEEAFRIPGVTGVLCTESNGLCLSSKGNVPSHCSGSISALASQASSLCPSQNGPTPVVCLESEYGCKQLHSSRKCLIIPTPVIYEKKLVIGFIEGKQCIPILKI